MIKTVVTRGFGNGTFNGTIALVVTRGYGIGAEPSVSGKLFGSLVIGSRMLGRIEITPRLKGQVKVN